MPSKLFLAFALLASALECKSEGFDHIEPSTNLTWTPCFDNFGCSKLKVPIDYSNPQLGTTSIAFVKLTGKNATVDSPSIIIIPGGPGGSGIDLLVSSATLASTALGTHYNIVSFDPRGVNNSGLTLDCFAANPAARSAFIQLHSTSTTNVSTPSLQTQFQSAAIYGEWCNSAINTTSPHAYYVTTPAVARDLLTFIEADARAAGRPPTDAKLWAYGVSYGTVIGSTFAAMFPDRVGRMVLDGPIDASAYYRNDWIGNVEQADEGIAAFSRLCHAAGPEKCAFWSSEPATITARLDAILDSLQTTPVPLSGVESRSLPAMVTSSDLKALFLNALYLPITGFPAMATALQQVETGNASVLAGKFAGLNSTLDARFAVMCADSHRTNNLTSLEEFKRVVEATTEKSRYVGDLWPVFQDHVLCRGLGIELPDSMVMQEPIQAQTPNATAYPILFASNTIDPITPLRYARTMSSRFANSVLLQQEAVGHTVINNFGSTCYFGHVQAYFQGVVPAANITCSQEFVPFMVDGDTLASMGAAA